MDNDAGPWTGRVWNVTFWDDKPLPLDRHAYARMVQSLMPIAYWPLYKIHPPTWQVVASTVLMLAAVAIVVLLGV